MKLSNVLSVAVTTSVLFVSGHALAAKKCDIVGTYTDTLGSTIVFKTAKTGTASNPAICASTYKLKVTKDTSKAIDTTGKAKGCGNLSAAFVPNYPTCTSATGTVTITGFGTFNDTITKQSGAVVSPRSKSSNAELEKGFR